MRRPGVRIPLPPKILREQNSRPDERMRILSDRWRGAHGLKAKLLSWSQSATLDNPLTSKAFYLQICLGKGCQLILIELPESMKSRLSLVAALTIAPLPFSFLVTAQTPTSSTSPSKQTNRPIPFHGMVSAVDQRNKTFTTSGKESTRVFKVTDKTSIMKGAGSGTIKDIADNEEVSGAYWKNPDGSLEAKIVKLGPTEKKSASPAPKASATPKS
jgi:hypothetical protein